MMNNELRPYELRYVNDIPWVDSMPAHWDVQRGKAVYKKLNRLTREIDEVVTCFRDGVVTLRKNRRTTGFTESIKEIGYQGIRRDDLVIHVMDAFAGAIGVSDSDGKGTPVYSVCESKADLNNYYYAYVIRGMAKIGFIQSLYRGIRERSSDFRFEVFANQYLPIPPRLEQDQIVKYLDHKLVRINKFIKAKKKLIAVLKEQKQAIINEAVTKGLDSSVKMKPSGIDWLGDVPEHWDVGKLKKYAKLNPSMKVLKSNYVSKDNVVFLSMDKISTDGDIDNSELRLIKDVRTGFTAFTRQDVVIAKITPCFENGKGACLENLVTELGYGTTELIVIRPDQTRLLGKYLYFVTRCEYFRIFGSEVMTGSAGQKRVPLSFVANFTVGFPEINEQKSIVDEIEKQHELINNSIKILNREIELITEYKNSLTSDVVTGKVDVRNIIIDETEDEVIEDPELDEKSIGEESLEAEDGD